MNEKENIERMISEAEKRSTKKTYYNRFVVLRKSLKQCFDDEEISKHLYIAYIQMKKEIEKDD